MIPLLLFLGFWVDITNVLRTMNVAACFLLDPSLRWTNGHQAVHVANEYVARACTAT
jgi:hypothetical protein